MFILTVRNDRLGDLILAVPTLEALRKRFPGARLGIVTAPGVGDVLELYPDAVEVWFDGPDSRERLRREPPDTMLFLYPDPVWARTAWRARVPRRIGTRHRLQAFYFNERVDVRRRHQGMHEALCNLRTAFPLIGDTVLTPPRFVVPQAASDRADRFLRDQGLGADANFVAIHPGSRGSAWHWPESHFTELARLLCDEGVGVVVTGGPDEFELGARVAGVEAVNLAGLTDLSTLGGILARASVLVVGSTGPMHLAAALGTPVVALFSPLPSHAPDRWGPLGVHHTVLTPATLESPGSVRTGREEDVMASISPGQVAEAVHTWCRPRECSP